jgi:S1-C subfamily serine protease
VQGNNDQSLLQIISAKKVGESVNITYWRDGSTKTVSMVLEAAK